MSSFIARLSQRNKVGVSWVDLVKNYNLKLNRHLNSVFALQKISRKKKRFFYLTKVVAKNRANGNVKESN